MQRTTLAIASLLLLAKMAAAEPVTTIRANGPATNRVDIVVLGDGYTAAEISGGLYEAHVETALNGIFAEQPYSEYRHFFNVHRIDVTSLESGADHPSRGVFRNTALNSAYDCANITRLICTDTRLVDTVIARSGLDPNARDILLVLVNDPEYGGSGGYLAVASIHPEVIDLVLHETGHSFGGLADEYGGPPPPFCTLTEPSSPNATMALAGAPLKWGSWIDPSTPIPTFTPSAAVPGLYPGAAYCDTDMYRPTWNSKMRSLGVPFEQINVEQHIKRIYNRVNPIDSVSPNATSAIVRQGQNNVFSVAGPAPLTHGLSIVWTLDGVVVGTGPQLATDARSFPLGTHTLSVVVADRTPWVRNDPAGVLRASRNWTVFVASAAAPMADFDGDGRSDLAVFRPSSAEWYVRKSTSSYGYGDFLVLQWGLLRDTPLTADFDGDGRMDLTVYRPLTGEWYIRYSSRGYSYNFDVFQWGLIGDLPLAADFDGDGRSDLVVYRPSSGEWFIRQSTSGYNYAFLNFQWGLPGDRPIPFDFDGDGRSDLAIYRPSTGEWYVRYSARGYNYNFDVFQWGLPGDIPLMTDFDGDRKTDLVIYRPSSGMWYVRRSSSGYSFSDWSLYQWGLLGDVPVSADFDGDQRTDLAVYRPSTGEWYVRTSLSGYSSHAVYQWGLPGDTPLAPNQQ